jgi:hypothetical protein
MGAFVGRGANIDPLAVSLEMRKALRPWQTVRVVILDPGANNVNFTAKNASAFKWNGWARYQPYRKDIPIAQVTNPTTTATARFQIDFTEDGAIPDIKTNYIVLIVTEPGVTYPDPFITQYVHVVTSSMNSSEAWVRTIETIVDTKTRENFAIQPNGSGGFMWVP